MSDYTPTTERVRHYWTAQGIKRRSKREKRAAEFDRWLASVKAEAWDEAIEAIASESDYTDLRQANPYRKEI